MLEYKISWKELKIFAQECSNDDLSFFMARSNLLSGILYGKSPWVL